MAIECVTSWPVPSMFPPANGCWRKIRLGDHIKDPIVEFIAEGDAIANANVVEEIAGHDLPKSCHTFSARKGFDRA